MVPTELLTNPVSFGSVELKRRYQIFTTAVSSWSLSAGPLRRLTHVDPNSMLRDQAKTKPKRWNKHIAREKRRRERGQEIAWAKYLTVTAAATQDSTVCRTSSGLGFRGVMLMRDSVTASTVGAISFRTGRPARHMYTPCGGGAREGGREEITVRQGNSAVQRYGRRSLVHRGVVVRRWESLALSHGE